MGPLFDAYRMFYSKQSDAPAGEAFLQERLRRDESVVLLARVDGRCYAVRIDQNEERSFRIRRSLMTFMAAIFAILGFIALLLPSISNLPSLFE